VRRLLQQFRFGLGLPSCNHAILRCCSSSGSRLEFKSLQMCLRSALSAEDLTGRAAQWHCRCDSSLRGRSPLRICSGLRFAAEASSGIHQRRCYLQARARGRDRARSSELRETQIEHDEIDPF
jgi:hypothetical protein